MPKLKARERPVAVRLAAQVARPEQPRLQLVAAQREELAVLRAQAVRQAQVAQQVRAQVVQREQVRQAQVQPPEQRQPGQLQARFLPQAQRLLARV